MPDAPCPICHHRLPTLEFRPFCSKRCANVDLGRWFAGIYAVPDTDETDQTLDPPDELG